MSRLRAAWKGSGASQPAHKMAETIAGQGLSKRVFYGQRILVIRTGGDLPDGVMAAVSEEHAVRLCDPLTGRTGRWFWCETVNGEPFTPPTITTNKHRVNATALENPRMKIEITASPVFRLPLTAEDVALLRELAAVHYDGHCKASGAVGGFLYGWWNMVSLVNLTDTGTGVVEREPPPLVRATFDQIDITLKIMEMAGPYLRGNRREGELPRVDTLRRDLRAALDHWNRTSKFWCENIDTATAGAHHG